MKNVYHVHFASLVVQLSRLPGITAYQEDIVRDFRHHEYFTQRYTWIPQDRWKEFPPELQNDLRVPRTVEAAVRLNSWLGDVGKKYEAFTRGIPPNSVLVFIVTTAQLEDFLHFCKASGIDKQKQYTLPPARNRNYPDRVNNPDKGFCLHTFVFDIDEKGIIHA
jgi:hypothetical protein